MNRQVKKWFNFAKNEWQDIEFANVQRGVAKKKALNLFMAFRPKKQDVGAYAQPAYPFRPDNDNRDYYGNWIWSEPPRERHQPFKNVSAFRRRMLKKGFQVLGSGHFSVVYSHPKSPDKVVKVCHSPDAWIDYCYWAAKNGHAGKFAPKVYSYKHYGSFYVAVMEKMEYTACRADKASEAPVAQTLFSYAIKNDNETAKMLCDLVVPGLAEFGDALKKGFKGERLDLHDENVMFRKDGSICITDPVCHETRLTVTRLRAADFARAA